MPKLLVYIQKIEIKDVLISTSFRGNQPLTTNLSCGIIAIETLSG